MKNNNTKDNNRISMERLVRDLSKGYFLDFSEYNPDATDLDDDNDHTKEKENDRTALKKSRVKKTVKHQKQHKKRK